MADEYLQTDISGIAWLNEYFNPLAELIKAEKFRWALGTKAGGWTREAVWLGGPSFERPT
jgi:hypothetical protein